MNATTPSSIFDTRQEIANAISHGIGALFSIAALVLLIVVSAIHGTAWHVAGFSIFGATMIILYMSSTLYHALTNDRAKHLFRKFDHMSIFLLIAGTYTPFCLTVLNNWIGWTVLGIVWSCAAAGIVVKAFHTGKYEKLSTFLYVMMGWIILPAIKPLYDAVPFWTFILLMAGGAFYTMGTYFFLKDQKRYYHSIWHLFVLAGTVSHFFSVLLLI
ncbi:PAQR family membrane homeostasis protein TrhA [Pseudochryseolinea flava]|uniref:Hemolysin D n=1 Tax=Pseudochryseolinea flava TaxID=2059302 RepID=A0A364YAH9_9BACT|nr:hemolysin III family protein [Pseudochryseolinea flava]RAW02868.1 hemolysin D [Pseudochryseolinea flava]